MEAPGENGAPSSARKIKILQLMKWLSPVENSGGKIRSFRLGKALSSFAEVDAAGFAVPGEESTGKEEHLSHYHRLYPFSVSQGTRYFYEVLASFTRGLSLRTARFLPGEFGKFVERIVRENRYDAIHVEELPMMVSLSAAFLDIPVIFSSHNVESELSYRLFDRRNPFFKFLANREYRRTVREERNAVVRARVSLVVSEKDRDSLLRLFGTKIPPIHVLPNCAHDRFQPSVQQMPGKGLLAVGSFGWYPNREGLTWFMDEVVPLLRKKFPNEVIRVVGSEMGMALRRNLERQGIEVHADVPDILPFLQAARMLFVPLRIGGGTRIKIMEAWAAGLPVVSTSLGAEGLPFHPGVNMLIADGAIEFAEEISRLLEDDGLYNRLKSEGLKESKALRWSGLDKVLTEIYRNVLDNREIM